MSDEVVEARSRETFVSNVSGRADSSRFGGASKKGKRGSGFFKKKHAPLLVIAGVLIAGIALVFISQSFMPFALVNRFIEEFNGAGISSTLRSDSILDIQLSSTGSYFGLSDNQRAALKESKIYPVDIAANGTAVTAIVYEESTGDWRAVVPKSVVGSNNLNDKISVALNNSNISLASAPISVEDALNGTFKTQYASASKTWRGGNSGWYDSMEDLTEARLAIRRTRFNSWTAAAFSGADEAWRKMAAGNVSSGDGGVSDYGSYLETDSEGNETTVRHSGTVDSSSLSGQTTIEGVRSALNSKIASVAKLAATVGCAGVEIMTAIQTYMSAQQSIQYLNLATGYFEAVQRAQIGQNDGTPMNKYNKILTTPDPETGKTPMGASTSQALFSGTAVDTNDESIKTVSFENLMSSLGTLSGNLNFTAQAFEACSYVKMGVAATNFVTTVLNFVPVLGQAVKAIHIVAKLVGKIALGATIAALTSFIIPKIINQVFSNVAKNVATQWVGEDYFNAMYSGAGKYIGGNYQTGGGSAGSKEALKAYNRAKSVVLAEEAELDRKTRSPFDLTSRNTFLGSIAYSLIPIATSSGVGTTIKSIGNVFTKSVSSLLPSASAVAETSLVTSLGECPIMNSVGAVCDPTGNPYYVDDLSTIDLTPAEIEAKIVELDPNAFKGENSNGQKIINPNSNLGKTAMILDQRIATLGIADASAANILVQQPSTIVANLPLVGDVAQIISALGEADNMPWISGSAGVNSEENPLWDEVKYYQRYISDQRLLEVAGITQKSSVTALLEDYYEQNPLDNSREGVIARYSGLTKDQVIAVEDTMDVINYIANYDPSTRTNFSQNDSAYAIIGTCQNNSCAKQRKDPLNKNKTADLTEPLMRLALLNQEEKKERSTTLTRILATAPLRKSNIFVTTLVETGKTRQRRQSLLLA